jgi:hypothetical protein
VSGEGGRCVLSLLAFVMAVRMELYLVDLYA